MLDTGEEKLKGRLINTLNPKWKKNGASVLLIAVLLFGILGTQAGCTIVNAGPSATEKSTSDLGKGITLDEAVKSAFLKENQGHYLSGECIGEGHIIIGHDEKSDITTVYALTMYGEYGFEDGNFVKVSGSGVIPAVFTFTNAKDGLVCTKIAYPEDGERYAKSIKKLFPLTYRHRALSPSDSDRQDLTSLERAYAASYLKKIGRDAVIGDYGDFNHTLLTDVGVSVEVSNITCGKQYANYPMWIGNREALENGTRYVYEMSYNKDAHEIDFKKYEYNTKKIVELIRLDSITGLPVK
ncbi:MAG: peptidase family protein [Firmicutes bacterium]|nr:peptidase family protein [Bacillota bacterium]